MIGRKVLFETSTRCFGQRLLPGRGFATGYGTPGGRMFADYKGMYEEGTSFMGCEYHISCPQIHQSKTEVPVVDFQRHRT